MGGGGYPVYDFYRLLCNVIFFFLFVVGLGHSLFVFSVGLAPVCMWGFGVMLFSSLVCGG